MFLPSLLNSKALTILHLMKLLSRNSKHYDLYFILLHPENSGRGKNTLI